jgi:Holliday junction resolvasome RuvABC endonuclease subunit
MRSAGIDIAKAGYSALGMAVDGDPYKVFAWKEDNKKTSEPDRLDHFYDWLMLHFAIIRPDIVAVEQVAGFHNRKVIQTLSRFEGVALLAAKRYGKRHGGLIVLNPMVGSSRNAALGIPASSKKELAFETIKARYPDFKFGAVNQGGPDKADAMTHALAAPQLLERR